MKNILRFLLVITAVMSIAQFTGCKGNPLAGAWQAEDGNPTVHLIINGNNFIFLSDGKEMERGVFETYWQTSKDNTFIKLLSQFETIYHGNFEPFVEEVEETDGEENLKYSFTKDGKLLLETIQFEKTKIPKSEISSINSIFENNKNNPDMRRTSVYNEQVYSLDIKLDDIRNMVSEGKFNEYAQKKGIKNGVLKDNVLYWRDNKIFIGVSHLQGVQNAVLKTGDEIHLAHLISGRLESEDNWTKAAYSGPDIPFSHTGTNFFGWYYNDWVIIGKLFFRNGEAVVEITEIKN